MFIDSLQIKFIAGKGGNGAVAFRREKYLPKGGPTGGDGGNGGSITLITNPHVMSFEKFSRKQILKAENGQMGNSNNRKGKNGKDLFIEVPLGSIIKDENDNILFEFTKKQEKFVLCKGGKNGRGNYSFRTSTNQAPNTATEGKAGEEKLINLELKLIADVGLIGMPNAGKSTLMKQITKSKVKIAAYPFTTLYPNLGIVEFDDFSRILIADIPGIIKGAHLNKGLGLSFLRHIERTSVLIYIIDINDEDPILAYKTLLDELKSYKEELLNRPFLTILNKTDLQNFENLKKFKKFYPFKQDSLIEISALEKTGLDNFLQKIRSLCETKF